LPWPNPKFPNYEQDQKMDEIQPTFAQVFNKVWQQITKVFIKINFWFIPNFVLFCLVSRPKSFAQA
jgi:hypothetical protein